MRHAREEDLEALEALLAALRATDGLTEKRPGVFYRRSKALLHFHVDDDVLFADVRTDPDGEFVRVRVATRAEQRRLLASIHRSMAPRATTTRT